MQNLYKELEVVLLTQDEYKYSDGKLNKPKIMSDATADIINPMLLGLLLENNTMRQHFFNEVSVNNKTTLVFDKTKFSYFISNKEFLPDSYTRYKKKVSLSHNDEPVISNKSVVLNFLYKDCVLVGGQDQDDAKRDEVFFNETLAPDDIDRLLDAKAFTNFKRYSADGVENLEEINKIQPQISMQDNFIIKGNNLLVLHSLKKMYAGKVKLIYIDPPYNTGNDSFKYNDNFNHSTWLVFMKNRLEVARDLLRDDGVIFCSINHIELPYILILMDELFERENRLPIITLKAGTTASYRSINDCPVNVTEYVVTYSMHYGFKPNMIYREVDYSEDYSHYIVNIADEPDQWRLQKLTDIIYKNNNCSNWKEYKKLHGDHWSKKRFEEMKEFALSNRKSVVSLNTLQKPSLQIQSIINDSKLYKDRVFEIVRDNKSSIFCFNGRTLAFFDKKFRLIDGKLVPTEIITNIWDDISFLSLGLEGDVSLLNGKKPEKLIKTIIELGTKPNDIVLDYHLGSGTTASVAHKMGRRYIGIEQMDYIEDLAVARLKKVIGVPKTDNQDNLLIDQDTPTQYQDYDNSGISKSVNWQGGGSFIYCELMQHNQQYIEQIKHANTTNELLAIWQNMQHTAQISYYVDIKAINNSVSEFEQLTIEEQKQFLYDVLDKNYLYVNYSEIADSDYKISQADKQLNDNFYTMKDNFQEVPSYE